jgi:hypothetical protein
VNGVELLVEALIKIILWVHHILKHQKMSMLRAY